MNDQRIATYLLNSFYELIVYKKSWGVGYISTELQRRLEKQKLLMYGTESYVHGSDIDNFMQSLSSISSIIDLDEKLVCLETFLSSYISTIVPNKTDFTEFSTKELENFGFCVFDDGKPANYLIPLYLTCKVQDGTFVKCINGSTYIWDGTLDLDHRAGCIAYGFVREV